MEIGTISVRLQGVAALLGGVGYPLVAVTCRNCGHAMLFNLVIMGLEKGAADGQP